MSNVPEPGTTLGGKYLVDQVLGVGGMGVVVAATHLQLDQRVALKFLLPAALANAEVVARFSREARAAAKIRGEHVARVIDVGAFDDGTPFMVMEYLEGHDLAKELEEKGPLPIADLARYILETCEALAEAHAAKIVHRDLKPSNLFLAEQPDKQAIIKVLDFGISKLEDKPTAGLTKTTALMGTAFYMSPEQLTTPKGVDQRSDIWALGVIIYELLTGSQPFAGESVPEIIASILQSNRAPIESLRADVPPGLIAVVDRCLTFKVSDRYSNVAELAAAIAPFASPDDRRSVAVIGRVLGERVSIVDPAPAPAVVRPSGATPPTSAVAMTELHSSSTGNVPAAPPSALTTHGLSSSVADMATPIKKPPLALIAGGVVVALAVLVGVGLSMRTKSTPAPATGLVSAVAESAPVATQVSTKPPDPSATVDPTPPAASSPVATQTATAVSPPAAAATAAKTVAPVVHVKTSAVTTSSASAVATVAKPPASAPTAAPTPTSGTSKNPLQMGIK